MCVCVLVSGLGVSTLCCEDATKKAGMWYEWMSGRRWGEMVLQAITNLCLQLIFLTHTARTRRTRACDARQMRYVCFRFLLAAVCVYVYYTHLLGFKSCGRFSLSTCKLLRVTFFS